MKENKLTITINKPIHEIFAFTLNPANTSLWIDAIVKEEANEFPAKLGTIYRNVDKAGNWGEYKITAFEQDKMFILSSINSPYHVKYTFTSLTENITEMEYYEWVDSGELEYVFIIDILEKLKRIIESV